MSYYKFIIAKSGARGLVAMSVMSLCLASVGVFAANDDQKDCDRSLHHSHHHRGGDIKHHEAGDREWSRGDHPRYARFLELTDAQKQSLKDFRTTQEPAQEALQEKIQVARDALQDAGESNANDESLNRLALDLAKLQAQKEVARIKAQQQFASVLTPEQKEKLSQWKAERGQRAVDGKRAVNKAADKK